MIAPVLPFPDRYPRALDVEVVDSRRARSSIRTRRPTSKSPFPPNPNRARSDDDPARRPKLAAAALLALPLASCISVKAPDKPIEINLNVDIRQEVLVRLQQDVEQMINAESAGLPADAGDRSSEVTTARCGAGASPAAGRRDRADAGGRCRARGGAGRASATTAISAFPDAVSAAVRSQVARSTSAAARSTAILPRAEGVTPAGRRHHRGLRTARPGRGG